MIRIVFAYSNLELLFNMTISQPTNITASRGDSCIFFYWSPIAEAKHYEIEVENTITSSKSCYRTNLTSYFHTKLDNGIYYKYQVRAVNENDSSEPSIPFVQRPIHRQPACTLLACNTDVPGRINLKWTGNPTDYGFKLDRCDIGDTIGYKSIAWLPNNQITTYEDQTNCDSSTKVCAGHYYSIAFRDSYFSTGGGLLSKKVFCMPTSTLESVDISENGVSSESDTSED